MKYSKIIDRNYKNELQKETKLTNLIKIDNKILKNIQKSIDNIRTYIV